MSVYNYAENEPIANIDLWGLQKYRFDGSNTTDTKGIIRDVSDEEATKSVPNAIVRVTFQVLDLIGLNSLDNAITDLVNGEGSAVEVFSAANSVMVPGKPSSGKTSPNPKLKTSNAARKEVMRQEGIPTSQQPKSQSKNASGREYTYEVPKAGGGTETKSVQQQTKDRSHLDQPHWEAGKVKTDPRTNKTRMNDHGRAKLINKKSKADYL